MPPRELVDMKSISLNLILARARWPSVVFMCLLCINDLGGTRVSRARVEMRTRYQDLIGDLTIVRKVFNVLVRCMMRMDDVTE